MNLTEEQIRKLEGRELDALVAKHVLGWVDLKYWPSPVNAWLGGRSPRGATEAIPVPRYSASAGLCFSEVIPVMREKGCGMCIEDDRQESQIYFFNDDTDWPRTVRVPFGEEATGIARAALLALRSEGNLAITEREHPCQKEEKENDVNKS